MLTPIGSSRATRAVAYSRIDNITQPAQLNWMQAPGKTDVFTATVEPLIWTAKRTGAKAEALAQAFLEAVNMHYGADDAKEAVAILGFRTLLEAEGGSVPTAQAVRLYGGPSRCTEEAVRKAARLGQLIAVRDGLGNLHFPVWQFGPRGGVLGGMREVLALLRKLPHFEDLTPLTFLLNFSARLGGRSPLEALRGQDPIDLETVKQLAIAAGE